MASPTSPNDTPLLIYRSIVSDRPEGLECSDVDESLLFKRSAGEITSYVADDEVLTPVQPTLLPSPIINSDDTSALFSPHCSFSSEASTPVLSPASSTSSSSPSFFGSPHWQLDENISLSTYCFGFTSPRLSLLPPDDDDGRQLHVSPAEIFNLTDVHKDLDAGAASVDHDMVDAVDTAPTTILMLAGSALNMLNTDSSDTSKPAARCPRATNTQGGTTKTPGIREQSMPVPIPVQDTQRQRTRSRKANILKTAEAKTHLRRTSARTRQSSPSVPALSSSSSRPSRTAKRKISCMIEDEESGEEDGDDDDFVDEGEDNQPCKKRAISDQIHREADGKFKCPDCHLTFTRKHDSERHHLSRHVNVGFKCRICAKVLSREDACRRHEIQQHRLKSVTNSRGRRKDV
ncbi:hypothetical protein VKT23_001169 [Stygiomarasmius scandens]|uniref:C2H2-type domain-containing protein n=1 Tax=Marasmiellus scandens TaxID=2682957 RepID=A0ABR1K6B8_9AGAR